MHQVNPDTVGPHVNASQPILCDDSKPESIDATVALTSICMHSLGTLLKSPLDGPSDGLAGLGTLAYHAKVEISISVCNNTSNNTIAQSFLATPDIAVSLALLLSMNTTAC